MLKQIPLLILVLALGSGASGFTKKGSSGKSYQTDGSQADVQRAIDAAPDNGTATVIIPAGTYDWNGTLSISKAVNLAGIEPGETVIRNQQGGGDLIKASSTKSGHIEIYNISFKQIADNGGGRGFTINATRDQSSQYTVLIHDCDFDQGQIYGYSLLVSANGIIVWNCHFIGSGGMGGISFVCGWDYESYNQPSTLGTKDSTGLKNSYIEDCSFTKAGTGGMNFDANSRTVFRHNMVTDNNLGSHGQETSPIGVTAWEIYDCTFKVDPNNAYNLNCQIGIRGGTGVIFNNKFDLMPWGKTCIELNIYSITRGFNDGQGGTCCPIEYPAPRQTGWSWTNNNANWGKVEGNPQLLEGGQSPGYFLPDGKGAVCDPVYVWGNTGTATNDQSSFVRTHTYSPDDCGNNQVIDTYLRKGRDFMVDQGPKPGYTPYPYPHPLRGGGGGGGPMPTPTPQPTPTPPGATPTPTPTPPPAHKHVQNIRVESDAPMTVTVTPGD